MTVAQLKRQIEPGQTIECTDAKWYSNGQVSESGVPERMQGLRTVTLKNTVGFYLNPTPEDGKRGSFCDWPRADELEELTDTTFVIASKNSNGEVWNRRSYLIAA